MFGAFLASMMAMQNPEMQSAFLRSMPPTSAPAPSPAQVMERALEAEQRQRFASYREQAKSALVGKSGLVANTKMRDAGKAVAKKKQTGGETNAFDDVRWS